MSTLFPIREKNSRSLGVADMAHALRSGRPHRANGEMAYHVLDLMHAIHDASEKVSLTNFYRCKKGPENTGPFLFYAIYPKQGFIENYHGQGIDVVFVARVARHKYHISPFTTEIPRDP